MRKLILTFLIAVAFSPLTLQSQTKVVLVEEGTGTWCSWCVGGIVYGHELLNAHPGQVLFVAIHSGDIMEIPGIDYFGSTGISGIPGANIDRQYIDQGLASWQSAVNSRLALTPPADVTLSRTYNNQTRELSITIEAQFYSSLTAGDYRLGSIVVEDGVHGTSNDYSQSNAYAGGGNGPMGGFENLPSSVPAVMMVYDHVARALPNGYLGAQGSLPSSPQAGQTYSYSYSLTLNPEFNAEYIKVYGFICDASTGEILNAGSSSYAMGDDNAVPFFHSDTALLCQLGSPADIPILAHDPDNDGLTISAVSGLPAWASIQMDGNNDARLTGTPNTAGTWDFILQVSDGVHNRQQAFKLTANTGIGDWAQVGDEGFSAQASEYQCKSAYNPQTNQVFALGASASDDLFIYGFDGTNWDQLGNSFSSNSLYAGDIQVNPATGELWAYIYQNNNGQVYKFSNNTWEQVGSSVYAGGDLEIRISNLGEVYIAHREPQGGPVKVYHFNGTDFSALPDLPNGAVYAWNRMEINSDGNPVLLVAEFSGWTGYSRVFEFDGTNWVALGGLINPDHYTTGSSSSLHQTALGPNDEVYTALAHDGGTNIYLWDGTNWNLIGEHIDEGIRESFDMGVGENGQLFFCYQNGNSSASCKVWDGNNWAFLGQQSFTNTIADVNLFIHSNGYPGVVYIDMNQDNGKLSAKQFQLTSNAIQEPTSLILNVYPNPAKNLIYIPKEIVPQKIKTQNALGQQVPIHFNKSTNSIQLQSYKPGIYFLSIEFNEQLYQCKVIIL